MWITCAYLKRMPTVQIRNMPEDLHRKLKSRAALAGMTLSDYLRAEFIRIAAIPTEAEMRERAEKLWGKRSDPSEGV